MAALARRGLVEQSLVLADYELGVHATYYFGARSSAIPQFLLARLYQPDDRLPTLPAIADARRVIVPLSFVLPDYRVGPYSGWTHAQGWVAFLSWLCDLEPREGPRPATHAALGVVETEAGRRYLVLDSRARVVGDLRDLLGELDALAGGSEPVFLAAGAALLSQGGQEAAQDVRPEVPAAGKPQRRD
jgi:hypothetical protein